MYGEQLYPLYRHLGARPVYVRNTVSPLSIKTQLLVYEPKKS